MRRIILSFIFLLFATFNIFAEDKTSFYSFFKSLDSISAACLTLLVVLFVFVIFSKFGPLIKEKLKHLKKVGSVEFDSDSDNKEENPNNKVRLLNKEDLKGQTNLSKDQVINSIYRSGDIAEDYTKKYKDLMSKLQELQLEKVKIYLDETISNLTSNYIEKVPNKDDIEDLSDILKLLLQRDFNELIYNEIKKLLKDDIRTKNDNDIAVDAERVSTSCLIRLRGRFINYPSMLGTDLLKQLFTSYESKLLAALTSCLIECKKMSTDNLRKEKELRENYDNEITGLINLMFQFDSNTKK
jgi:hypothetical protein